MPIHLSYTAKSQLTKILWITLGWTIISVFYFFTVYAQMVSLNRDISGIDPWLHFKGSIITGILAGILGGGGMILYWEKWLRTRKYGQSLINILFTYSIIYLLVGIPTNLFVTSQRMGLSPFHSSVWGSVLSDIVTIGSLNSYLFWLITVLATLVVLQVNDKYGPGVFKAFLLGKYFQPTREERIFMFLDLRSSTTIAETLGEEKYFNFLKDIFNISTPSILKNKGEIYQYVGDEIVVSWKTGLGIENANCIKCFFDIKNALQERNEYFESKFSFLPEFKAGLHYGYVMAGEIGMVKRDIAFSGDVLNTTSRIQGMCNQLGTDILISDTLFSKLNLANEQYKAEKLGAIELKGKQLASELFSIQQKV